MKGARARFLPALLIIAGLVAYISVSGLADGGVWGQTAHGNPFTGANRIWSPAMTNDSSDTASCANCHLEHASYNDGSGSTNSGNGYDYLLALQEDLSVNDICFDCHSGTDSDMPNWPGRDTYITSAHGNTAGTPIRWNGDAFGNAARTAADDGLCINCHNPHGRRVSNVDNLTGGPNSVNGSDPVFDMVIRQEENLCLNCHKPGGQAGADDIQSALSLQVNASPTFYGHPIDEGLANSTLSDHTSAETATPVNDGANTRHVECVDCHNPHTAKPGAHTEGESFAGPAIYGSWGVIQTSWPAAPAPSQGNNNLPAAPSFQSIRLGAGVPEYTLCFRCHSSFSTLPTFAAPDDITDISREINPNNMWNHPIAGPLSTAPSWRLPPWVWVNGWDTTSIMTCSDCHRYDPSTYNYGPHGSNNPWILDTYDTTQGGLSAEQKVFCFNCHNYNTYYDASGYHGSMFDHATNGNHVDNSRNSWGIWCMTCHGGRGPGEIHGTNRGKGVNSSSGNSVNLGMHFFNGAAIRGLDDVSSNQNMTCYTTDNAQEAASPYVLNCSNHSGGRNFTGQWNDYY